MHKTLCFTCVVAADLECVVCRHKRVADIDAAQARGVDELTLAQHFSVTKVALRKHLSHKSVDAGNGTIPLRPANVVELRPCAVCSHLKRPAIDIAIARGETWTNIGRLYALSGSTVRSHAEKCLREALRSSPDERSILKAAAKTARERCHSLLATAEQLIERAATDEEASYRDRAALITAAKGALELLGRFSGEIGPAAEILVIDSPRWKRIEAKIAEALVPYPDAAKAVAKALQDLEAA